MWWRSYTSRGFMNSSRPSRLSLLDLRRAPKPPQFVQNWTVRCCLGIEDGVQTRHFSWLWHRGVGCSLLWTTHLASKFEGSFSAFDFFPSPWRVAACKPSDSSNVLLCSQLHNARCLDLDQTNFYFVSIKLKYMVSFWKRGTLAKSAAMSQESFLPWKEPKWELRPY